MFRGACRGEVEADAPPAVSASQLPATGALWPGVAAGLQPPAPVPKRVLVIDDLSYMRDIQVLLLKEAGYTATAMATAREALERLGELVPDLILLDLSMPGMDGRQFLRRLRATPQWKMLPVILTTGRTVEEVRAECDCEVLSKPFSDAALLDRVRRLIGDANEQSRAS